MTNSSMQQELNDIKAQLEQMKAQRQATNQSKQEESDADNAAPEQQEQISQSTNSETQNREKTEEDHDSVAEQVRELIDHIEKELDSSSPTALIAVFALGVLVGRLLPK